MSAVKFDLVVRGGLVVDGEGPAYEGDVGVKQGRIVAVGHGLARGQEEIDARGMVVTPGFVDIHTHYDGQATWCSRLEPSSAHGTTTVVMGNCGVGFAPCRERDRTSLIRLMEGVEDIPGSVLAEGLPWDWEDFPGYLDALERRPRDIDVGAQIPHAALRVYAMGQRGIDREAANDEDIQLMRTLADQAIRAGALGLGTSRTIGHRTADGDPTPMYGAAARELSALCQVIGRRGVFQMVSDFEDEEAEFAFLLNAARSGVAMASFSLAQHDPHPDMWRSMLKRLEAAGAEGLPVRAQVICRPVGVIMGLEASFHPFVFRPSYQEIAHLPLRERLERMASPERRAAILAEQDAASHALFTYCDREPTKLFPLGQRPDYAPPPGESFAAMARRCGRPAAEIMYDYLLSEDGHSLIYLPIYNYTRGNLDDAREMLLHPLTLHSLSDGGAHVGAICDASAATYLLTYWVRERKALSLEDAVRMLTRRSAAALGLLDRGILKPGYKADINVIDLDALAIERPRIVRDLPAGGKRFLQDARGFKVTVVSGAVTRRDGAATGALPGRLVRGRQVAPVTG